MDLLLGQNSSEGLRADLPRRPPLSADVYEHILREQQRSSARELVRFSFLQIEPAWRRLPAHERAAHREEFAGVVEEWGRSLMVYSYSLVGTRGDSDLMLWQATSNADLLHGFDAALRRTALGSFMATTHSFLGMTRVSIYNNRYESEYLKAYGGSEQLMRARVAINPQGSKFLFVYPFSKTREWYALPHEERQRMMDEHIAVGRQWPDIKLNTAYSYGLDDQEFVMAFETDSAGRFVDLLMALRVTEASRYTLRDTPSFTCMALGIHDCLGALG
jgi:chlorite dismutase